MRNRDKLKKSSRVNRAHGAVAAITLCIGFVAVPAMAAAPVGPAYSTTPTDPVVAAKSVKEIVNNPAAALPGPVNSAAPCQYSPNPRDQPLRCRCQRKKRSPPIPIEFEGNWWPERLEYDAGRRLSVAAWPHHQTKKAFARLRILSLGLHLRPRRACLGRL